MFLSILNDEHKLPFLALADAVIRTDETLAQEETDLLHLMKIEMGLEHEIQVPAMDIEEAAKMFVDRQFRVAVMLELVGLGYAEGTLNAGEAAVLERISNALEFSPADYVVMENWVLRQIALAHEAKAMMEAAN
jgi:uncharacterized tellurite resistance protein B-like protein